MSKFLDKTGLDTFWAKIKSTFQTLGNLVTSWGSTPSDTKYPSEKLVKTALDGKVDKVSGKGLSTNDYTTTEKNKLAGIASGAEVNVQSDWNQTTTTADDYIKNKPTIPSGTQLVYDCGTGSTSGTDFDNALAAYQAGKWVILHYSSNPYYCVGTYNSGLRFKRLANESSLIKIDTVNWTRGSAPSAATQLEAALVGHTHSNYVPTSRTINGAALTDNLSAADIGLPSTWNASTGPTYGIALDEGGIDQSLKNISNSTGSMTTDTYFLVHDAIGESSRWYARKINKLWDWVQDKIAAVLRLYTRNNDTPYFDGLAANAVQATKSTNADITRTADTANGDKLQIGTGTAVNITNAVRANYADSAGSATDNTKMPYTGGSDATTPNFNSYTTPGVYTLKYSSGDNLPPISASRRTGYSYGTLIVTKLGNDIYQLWHDNSYANFATRVYTSSAWSSWEFPYAGTGIHLDSSNVYSQQVTGVLSTSNGGTGVTSISALQTSLGLGSAAYKAESYFATAGHTHTNLSSPRVILPDGSDGSDTVGYIAARYGNSYSYLQAGLNLAGIVTKIGSTTRWLCYSNASGSYFVGNADTATSATKATQDGNGNNIADTYAPLSSVLRIGEDSTSEKNYDLDTFTARGFYFINIKSGSNNAPGTGHYTLIVTSNGSGTRRWQVAIGYYMKVRRYTGSAWTAWQTIATMPA